MVQRIIANYLCDKLFVMKKIFYFIITWILISIPVFLIAQPQHNTSAITQTQKLITETTIADVALQ
jgi:hypothetical protein